MLAVGDGFLCIEYQLGIQQVVVCVAKLRDFPRFYTKTEDNAVSDVVADLRRKALDHGATLEAIQLLGTLIPLTTKEEEMAKSPTAAASAEKLKTKATATPAPKEPKGAVGRVAVEFDYKIPKGAKNTAREGTWAHHMVETIMAHTDTASARAANAKAKGQTPKGTAFSDKALDFAWARAQGFIAY